MIQKSMGQEQHDDMRELIAETLERGASLLVRHLARGTSLTWRAVLATLACDGPTRLTTLASSSGVSQPAMTQLVGRMEREGLVVRLIDPEDARATLVEITEEGQALRAELTQSQHERLAELLDTLSTDEEVTLGLAMRVASPLIEKMIRQAAENSTSRPVSAVLTT
jgi:DNA-binding MarR family transcriptional regulator